MEKSLYALFRYQLLVKKGTFTYKNTKNLASQMFARLNIAQL